MMEMAGMTLRKPNPSWKEKKNSEDWKERLINYPLLPIRILWPPANLNVGGLLFTCAKNNTAMGLNPKLIPFL